MLEVRNVSKVYHSGFLRNRKVNALNDISFTISEGDIFGIAGESGCGKTTISKIVMGLLPATSGSVLFDGRDITHLKKKHRRALRQEIQMVFQNPQMTFNPRETIYAACAEPIRNYSLAGSRAEEEEMIVSMLERVGVSKDQLEKYPHELSGGQAQRVSIARTLVLKPRLLICDEPTSMLDISVQAQILSLLKEIHESTGLAMMYISHNLDVIQAICTHVAVMRQGEFLEVGETEKVFGEPEHEYTKMLLASRL